MGVPLKFPRIVQFLSRRVFFFFCLLSVFNVLTCLGAIDNHDFHTAFAQTLLSFQHLFHRFAVMELWVQLGDRRCSYDGKRGTAVANLHE